MTTAKKKFLVGYYLKIVFSGENEPLVVVMVCVWGGKVGVGLYSTGVIFG